MFQVRCPLCNKLLGVFDGHGEMTYPRCRGKKIIQFDCSGETVKIRVISENSRFSIDKCK